MEKNGITIRKAKVTDATHIKNLVNNYANQGLMLPISINQIYEGMRNFSVIEKNGKVIGCGALKIVWKDLAEIRSVAIDPAHKKKGHGKNLINKLLEEAKGLDLKKVFVLTYVPRFFEKFGFEKIQKSRLPHKVWFDCINCPKFPKCDEIALRKSLLK